MAKIRIYEPALCCNTGVCGPDVDQALVTFSADLEFFAQLGVDIKRYNLANDPMSFAQNPIVTNFLEAAGSDGLPLVLVDDVTVLTGRYPTREMLARFAGFQVPTRPTIVLAGGGGGCCGGGSC